MRRPRCAGFTLIEMLVVMALLALLLTLALPHYFAGHERGKEAVLVENLRVSREAIDRFFADQGRYPDSLGELVQRRYLRTLPFDPVAGRSDAWLLLPPAPPERGQVADLRSGAAGAGRDGRPFGSL
ncbi:MAG TPA: prepilin-type N-terminal cleavage/methylation domain-containing protein [Methylibium sp.]|uniref:type II secretion system protein n=1 Tax=Methylibium sp. TaxID=2067992 RepID=UPI002DB63FF2|nr:prepilin-type N-terminal cleavage/methylation domain-containing protein [Methylibium sp.]HEU4460140.1 prepilin-type N-terminal cleavage/methylation domain-containing protein [Methylibium sp.]